MEEGKQAQKEERGQDWLEDDGERKGDKKEVQNV